MRFSGSSSLFARLALGLLLAAGGVTAWMQRASGQTPAQIGAHAPLPVYVTNPALATMSLPEGFVPGSRWKFTTWTMPSVITWTATVTTTSGAWANLTITTEDRVTTTRWYFVPNMPGSWERQ